MGLWVDETNTLSCGVVKAPGWSRGEDVHGVKFAVDSGSGVFDRARFRFWGVLHDSGFGREENVYREIVVRLCQSGFPFVCSDIHHK